MRKRRNADRLCALIKLVIVKKSCTHEKIRCGFRPDWNIYCEGRSSRVDHSRRLERASFGCEEDIRLRHSRHYQDPGGLTRGVRTFIRHNLNPLAPRTEPVR